MDGGAVSARAIAHTPIWCALINFPEHGDASLFDFFTFKSLKGGSEFAKNDTIGYSVEVDNELKA